MFKIEDRFLFTSDDDLLLIDDEYEDIHFDEVPILFTGLNRYDSRILGSSVGEDRKLQVERYLHVLTAPEDYIRFVQGTISYREIVLNSKVVFVIDESYDRTKRTIYAIRPTQIPSEYVPLPTSFYPRRERQASFTFDTCLKGRMAELHRAMPSDLKIIESVFPDVAKDSMRSLGSQKPLVFVAAHQPSSFKIRFQIESDIHPSLFSLILKNRHEDYVRAYIDYCINKLPSELALYADNGDLSRAPALDDLLSLRSSLTGAGRDHKAAVELMGALKASSDRLLLLKEIIGIYFSRIDIFNVTDEQQSLIGTIDEKTTAALESSIDSYEVRFQKGSEDKIPKEYQVLIYQLNTESRNGFAYLQQGDSAALPKIRISISGSEPLERTQFTQSLHESTSIAVRGRMKFVEGRPKSLKIESP